MIHFKLISDRRHQYPAIRSLRELFVYAEIVAYDSQQYCFVVLDSKSKQIPERMFPISLEQQRNILFIHFRDKLPNTEMKSEIQNQMGRLIHASETPEYSVLLSDLVG